MDELSEIKKIKKKKHLKAPSQKKKPFDDVDLIESREEPLMNRKKQYKKQSADPVETKIAKLEKNRKYSRKSDCERKQTALTITPEIEQKIVMEATKRKMKLYQVIEKLLIIGLQEKVAPKSVVGFKSIKNIRIRTDIKEDVFNYLDGQCSVGDFLHNIIEKGDGLKNVY